jgi:ATP-dependent DNA helicase RecG
MSSDPVKLLIAEGEGLTVEFKERFTPRILEDLVAFANGRGGRVLLGVSDDGKIKGEKLTNSLKSQIVGMARNCDPSIPVSVKQAGNVVVIDVAEGPDKPYSCSAGYYRRLDAVTQKMTQKEIKSIFRETVDKLFEDLPRKDCSLEDISIKKIRAFLAESRTPFKVNRQNLVSFLTSLGIYKEGEVNNAGALMFARDIGKFIPHAEVICGAFKGTNKTFIYDRKDVRNDLLIQLDEAMAFLQRQLNVRSEIRGINRHDIYELPLDALREAVVNAIIHRDYSFRGTSIHVEVYDDRVEIVNPGGLPQGLDKKDFGKMSVRRNLILADLFHRMGKVERIGSGISRMKDMLRAAGLRPPEFEVTTFFKVIFYRNPEYSMKAPQATRRKTAEKGREKSKEKSKEKILQLMIQNPEITTRELSEALGLSMAGIEKAIRILKGQKKLRRIGPDKGGQWEVLHRREKR